MHFFDGIRRNLEKREVKWSLITMKWVIHLHDECGYPPNSSFEGLEDGFPPSTSQIISFNLGCKNMGAQAGSRKTMLEVVLLSTSGWFYVVFFPNQDCFFDF